MAKWRNLSNGDRPMNRVQRLFRNSLLVALSAAAITLIGHSRSALADEITVVLSGAQEIPPVMTSAAGTATLSVALDKSISAKVTVWGMTVTVAHLHEAGA